MRLLEGPWPARAGWVLLPVGMGPALGDALDATSRAVSVTGAAMAWGTWAGVLVAVLLPRTVSLTALRTVAPLALAVAIWAGLAAERGGADLVGVSVAALAVVTAFAPTTGDSFVNGSSYGDERRMPLRVPGTLLLGPLPVAWAAAVAGPVSVPLLLAAQRWVAAGAALAVGLPAAVLAVRALHGLARRWVVFVPAGLVLHDLHALADPVLFPRSRIHRLGPALVGADATSLDLTLRSLGLALELELVEPLQVAPRRGDGSVELDGVDRVLFTPTRPAAVLEEAANRRIPVGAQEA